MQNHQLVGGLTCTLSRREREECMREVSPMQAAHKRFTSQASVMQEPGLKSWAFRRLHAQLTAPWEAHSVLFEAIAASSTGKPP